MPDPQQNAPHRSFSSRALWSVGRRYLLRHPWQSALMILGIALGVAVVVAVDLANASATRAFDYSTDAVVGRATHQIVAGPQGLDESVYVAIRREGVVRAAAPIVTQYVSSPQLGDRPQQLLGIDPFAEPPFRSYLWAEAGTPVAGLADLLTRPGAIVVSADVAARYGLVKGTGLTLVVAGYEQSAFIAGLLKPVDSLSRRALDGILLADIATAQELTGRLGRLDRVDLILPEGETAQLDRISSLLPQGARILPVDARSGTVKEMTAAFRLNLLALSLLALVVGMFLIYNTMTFSVVQRRPLFGTLRCLGVTRREVFALVVSEALTIGTLGAVLGLGLGILLGQGAVNMVTQTINDLFFVLTVQDVEIPASSLVKGGLLGIIVTAIAAALPAWEAASVPARAALSRSGLETKARRAVAWLALGGVIVGLLGAGVLALPTRGLTFSFGGTFAVILGFALLTPLTTIGFMRGATPLFGHAWGTLGRMAPRNVVNSLSRTAIAVAALMVAVSVTIGVSLMIGSFRHTVVAWLDQVLMGDVYISVAGFTSNDATIPLDPAVLEAAEGWPGVARVDTLRSVTADSPDGPVSVFGIRNPDFGQRPFLSADGPPQAIWKAMQNGAVTVSEPYANRTGLPQRGASVTLYTDQGTHTFPVAGIYYDYVSSQGTVSLSLDTYRQFWNDDALTAVSLRLEPGTDADAVVRDLQDRLAPVQQLFVRPNQALREEALVIFDRTFAITSALQLLATVVAFIGVLSALLSLQLEKQRELGILRAVGLTARQLWGLVILETGLMGTVAGLLAMPTGFVLSLILIYIINRRSFGWTLQMQVEPTPFILALAVAVTAAVLAGVYPARRMGQMMAAEALRYE
ncbi:MAG: ABC transporter permease [Anaerolineae bacterium]|nr:MAG: ABC transporter permease [Anaerolineae bacterium]